MISSMTPEERRDPDLLAKSPSRRRRIAKGCGHSERDLQEMIRKFQQMRSMMKQVGMGGMGGMPSFPGMGGMNPFGGSNRPGWRPTKGSGSTKKKKGRKKGFGEL